MFKKLAAMVCAAMLLLSGVAFVGARGTRIVKVEKVPVIQRVAYKFTYGDWRVLRDHFLRHAQVDPFMLLFFRVYKGRLAFPNSVIMTATSYPNGKGYLELFVPEEGIVYMEMFGDGDFDVDAVGIFDEGGLRVIRYVEWPKPSVYSAEFLRHMSYLVHNYAYPEEVPAVWLTETTGGQDGEEESL